MKLKDLVPWKGEEGRVPIRREEHPFARLQKEINSLFEDFVSSFRAPFLGEGSSSFTPRVNVEETSREVRITAELPGMEEKDVSISLTDDALVIQGERRQEEQKEEGAFSYHECSYGAFRRVIPVGPEIDADKVEARMRHGVLDIRLPKTEQAQKNVRKIPVRTE